MTHAEKLLHKAERSFVPETALKYIHLAATNADQQPDRAQKFASYRTNAYLAFALFHIARDVQKPQVTKLVHDNLNLAQQFADRGSPADGLLKVDRAIVALRSKRQPNHHSAIIGLHQVTEDDENPNRAIDVALSLYAIGFIHSKENLYEPAQTEISRLIPDRHQAFLVSHKALIKAQLTDIHDNLMPLISSVWITKSEVQQVIDHIANTLTAPQYQK